MSKKYIFTKIWLFLSIFASAISIASNIDNSNEVSKEREKYVRKSVEILDKHKVPFAWASFGLDRTLFKNETRKYGIEKLRQPDCGLLEAMGLKCKTSYEASNP